MQYDGEQIGQSSILYTAIGRQYTKCTTVTHKMAKITQNLKSRSNICMLK